ncbi:fimbrial assembly protein [Salinibacterium sp. M195]|uniref:fimbrial assembly protein n=1 Tax=Salinibacterium sp. M195 TaxID=2583374 RepID=UPI002102BE3D|nr:fimbrial assembly protein [Salinibacterium sp. M195]QYH35332.1 fimbrial assembly protein [Salinibacterium sp. M195]
MSDKKPTVRREVKITIAYPPTVNLLPPEVGQRKAAARARGRAIFIALIALGVVILAAAAANLYALQRAISLENARALTLSLTAQQGEYNEVRSANQLLQSTQAARIFALSTEVSVKSLTDGLGTKLSSGMAVTSFVFDTATPLQEYGQSLSPLDPAGMAKFSVEVSAPSQSAVDVWVRALPSLNGVLDAALVATSLNEDGGLTATVSVFVGTDALLHRFDAVAEEDDAAAEEESAEQPAETPAPATSPEPTPGTTNEEDGS